MHYHGGVHELSITYQSKLKFVPYRPHKSKIRMQQEQLMFIPSQASTEDLNVGMQYIIPARFCKPYLNFVCFFAVKINDQAIFVQKLVADKATENAYYGQSVAISDGLIAVGSPGASKAYLYYENNNGGWTLSQSVEQQSLTLRAEDDDVYFGGSVSVNSGALVAGAPKNDDGVEESGSASLSFIVKRSGTVSPSPRPTPPPTGKPTGEPTVKPGISQSFATTQICPLITHQ
jgi:hypothetical protein